MELSDSDPNNVSFGELRKQPKMQKKPCVRVVKRKKKIMKEQITVEPLPVRTIEFPGDQNAEQPMSKRNRLL